MNFLDMLVKHDDGTWSAKTDKGSMLLFVGGSGSGKGAAAASFAELGPVYVFDIDNRFDGYVKSVEWLGFAKAKLIDYDQYDMMDGYEGLSNKLDTFLAQSKTRDLKYKTIVLDSITSLNTMLMIAGRKMRGDNRKSQGGKDYNSIGGLRMLDPSDYNYGSMGFRQLIYQYMHPMTQAGVNFIVSGWLMDKWVKPKIDRENGITEYSPKEVDGQKLVAPQQLSEEIPGYFNEVYEFKKFEATSTIIQHKVKFNGDFAKTALPLPNGEIDVTKKSFYNEWSALVKSTRYTPAGDGGTLVTKLTNGSSVKK